MKKFIAGLLSGVLIATTIPVIADTQEITALVDNTITMIIAGNAETLPSDYSVLNYKGYTYLPSRFVAEKLGATVSWDNSARIISITAPPVKTVEKIVEVPVEVEKIVYVEKEGTSSSNTYSSLPEASSSSKVSINIEGISTIKNGVGNISSTRVSGDVKNNNNQEEVHIDYANAVIIADGVEYKTTQLPSMAWDDGLLYDNIAAGDDYSGYFAFPVVDQKAKNFIFKVPILVGSEKSTIEIKFSAEIDD